MWDKKYKEKQTHKTYFNKKIKLKKYTIIHNFKD